MICNLYLSEAALFHCPSRTVPEIHWHVAGEFRNQLETPPNTSVDTITPCVWKNSGEKARFLFSAKATGSMPMSVVEPGPPFVAVNLLSLHYRGGPTPQDVVVVVVTGWLLYVSATRFCISGADLLRYV